MGLEARILMLETWRLDACRVFGRLCLCVLSSVGRHFLSMQFLDAYIHILCFTGLRLEA